MSKFDKDSSINYERMAENLKIVRDRLDLIQKIISYFSQRERVLEVHILLI